MTLNAAFHDLLADTERGQSSIDTRVQVLTNFHLHLTKSGRLTFLTV